MQFIDESVCLRGCYPHEAPTLDGPEDEVQVRCLTCGSDQRLTIERLKDSDIKYWVCREDRCLNILALYRDAVIHQPIELLQFPGNFVQHRIHEPRDIGGITVDSSNRTWMTDAVWLANWAAKATVDHIGRFRIGIHSAILALDGGDVVGYLAYCPTSDETELVLRHLYLAESYRNQGIGSALVKFWWDEIGAPWYGEEAADHYFVESPNSAMKEVLRSVGHAKGDDGPNAHIHQVM